MQKPRALRPGARIAVVSPASPFPEAEFSQGLDELRALGFEPVVDPRVFERRGFVSGRPEVRAAVLTEALAAKSIDAVIAARGGYGSVHLLPLLDANAVLAARKPVIGYSDITSLLQFVSLGCGLVCFHGPTVAGRLSGGARTYDRDSFLRTLTFTGPIGALEPPGLEVVRPGEAAGPLFGGTLTQICASLGTPFAFAPPPGFVFFVDEVNERPYRLDRLLTQAGLAGVLRRASAVVFGELPGCDEPGGQPAARSVAADLLSDFPGPVLWGFPSGHTTGPAWTLPFGVQVRVVATGSAAVLVVEEAAVE